MENPFQSPQYAGGKVDVESDARKRARRSFHTAALVLLVPALYNFWEFHVGLVGSGSLPIRLVFFYAAVNGLGLALGFLLISFLGLPALEAVAQLLRRLFAPGADQVAWEEILHQSLPWAANLAVPGAVLWMIWVHGFYRLHLDFLAISWAIGVPAHVLGACWYIPLIYRWYQLAVSQQ